MSVSHLFDTFFIPSKGGLNLGFSDEERKLAETVHSIAFTEIKRHPNASEIDTECGKEVEVVSSERIELSKKNLSRIFELLEKAKDAREEFLENYPDWCVLRKEAIQKLTEIEQTIHKEKFWCNVGKMAGHVIGGAGAVAIASVFFFPPAAPAAVLPACLSGIASFVPSFLLPAAPAIVSPLLVNGGIAAGVGGVSSLGTKAAELILLRQRMEAAKKVLQGDKIAFAYMENWFKHTKELIDAVEDVIGFDVIKQLSEDMDALFVDIKGLYDLKNKSPSWLNAAVKLCVRQMLTGRFFAKYLGHDLSAVIVTFLFVVVFLSRRNRFVFKCIVKTKELMSRFHIDIDAVAELARVFAAVTVGGSSAIECISVEAAKEVSLGVCAGLGIAISAANIVLTSIDVKNGSTCKQREEVKKAAEKLQEELDLLEKVYNAVDTTEALSKQISRTSEIQDSEEISHKTHEKLQDLVLSDESEDTTQNLTLVRETQDSEEISHKTHEKLQDLVLSDESEDTTRNLTLVSETQDSEEISHRTHEKLQDLVLSDESEDTTQNLTLVRETQDSEEISHKTHEKLQDLVLSDESEDTTRNLTLVSETQDSEEISHRTHEKLQDLVLSDESEDTTQNITLVRETQDSEEISHKTHEKLQDLVLSDESEDTTQNLTLVSETQDSEEISHKTHEKLQDLVLSDESEDTTQNLTLVSETQDSEEISH